MAFRTRIHPPFTRSSATTTADHAEFRAPCRCAAAVLVLLSALLPVLLAAPPAGAQSDGDSVWESALTGLRVKTVLLDKLGTDALGIDVEVEDGEALLTGAVDDRSTQELAEQAALSVDGVRTVDNKLRLRRETSGSAAETAARDLGDELADARLEGRVHLRLFGEIGRHAGRLTVEAVDGVVSLRGNLPDRERKKLTLRTVRATKGVDKVVDLIEVEE